MKVKCIRVQHYTNITVGKVYEARDNLTGVFNLKNDSNIWCHYDDVLFEIVTEEDEPKRFGELAELDQMALFAAWLRGEVIENYCTNSKWYLNNHPSWANGVAYRIKPVELTKPSIDWSHVHEDYKWMATDEEGGTFVFTSLPRLKRDVWSNDHDEPEAAIFTSFKVGTCDWKDSLVERPHA